MMKAGSRGFRPETEVVIGNRRSRVDHKPNCRGAATMSEKNASDSIRWRRPKRRGIGGRTIAADRLLRLA
jgi:hypothetical protein